MSRRLLDSCVGERPFARPSTSPIVSEITAEIKVSASMELLDRFGVNEDVSCYREVSEVDIPFESLSPASNSDAE